MSGLPFRWTISGTSTATARPCRRTADDRREELLQSAARLVDDYGIQQVRRLARDGDLPPSALALAEKARRMGLTRR